MKKAIPDQVEADEVPVVQPAEPNLARSLHQDQSLQIPRVHPQSPE